MTDRWLTSARQRQAEIEHLKAMVCEHFGVSEQALIRRSRTRRITRARQIYMHLMNSYLGLTHGEIAQDLSRGRSDISHNCRTIQDHIGTEPETKRLVDSFVERMRVFEACQAPEQMSGK